MKKNYKIGIALGGGAARGYAHIGVLNAIDELNIQYHMFLERALGHLLVLCIPLEILKHSNKKSDQEKAL